MSLKTILITLVVAVYSVIAAPPSALSFQGHKSDKPNIVFMLIDDKGAHDLGCTGSTYYDTPHVDQLASEGMLFLNAYSAAPVYLPSLSATCGLVSLWH